MMKRLKSSIRSILIEGLLVLIPLVITVYLAYYSFLFIHRQLKIFREIFKPMIPNFLYTEFILDIGAIFILILFLWFAGLIISKFIGKWFGTLFDRMMSSIPLVRTIYRSLNELIFLLFSQRHNSFSKVVITEFPQKGHWVIGLITGTASAQTATLFKRKNETIYKVFIPGTPNPTTGFLLMIPESRIIETGLTVEQAVRMIVSGGVLKK